MEMYCPKCKSQILFEDKEAEPCKHTAFIYLDSIREFEYIDKKFKSIIKKAEKISNDDSDELYDESVIEILEKKFADKVDIESETETGMCCGPCSFTVYVGFKKDKKKSKAS